MPRFSDLGALRCVDPTEWKNKIKDAMAKAEGRPIEAAKLLDISERQMYRWLAEPILADVKRVPIGEPRNGRRGQKAVLEESPKRRRKSA